MAGIEKVCEFSGEYPGWLMYGYKRNHIQIMPVHRKAFAHKEHTLYIQKKTRLYEIFRGGGSYTDAIDKYCPEYSCFKWHGHWWKYSRRTGIAHRAIVKWQHEYCLHVPDNQGEVGGLYYNHTFDLGSVKRRLKRMLKCKKLKIVYIDDIYKDTEFLR